MEKRYKQPKWWIGVLGLAASVIVGSGAEWVSDGPWPQILAAIAGLASVVGTVVALLSAIVNMVFLPAYPIWSTLMIALAVVVVMALTVHGSEIKAGE